MVPFSGNLAHKSVEDLYINGGDARLPSIFEKYIIIVLPHQSNRRHES